MMFLRPRANTNRETASRKNGRAQDDGLKSPEPANENIKLIFPTKPRIYLPLVVLLLGSAAVFSWFGLLAWGGSVILSWLAG
jgi:hypothetical protein